MRITDLNHNITLSYHTNRSNTFLYTDNMQRIIIGKHDNALTSQGASVCFPIFTFLSAFSLPSLLAFHTFNLPSLSAPKQPLKSINTYWLNELFNYLRTSPFNCTSPSQLYSCSLSDSRSRPCDHTCFIVKHY